MAGILSGMAAVATAVPSPLLNMCKFSGGAFLHGFLAQLDTSCMATCVYAAVIFNILQGSNNKDCSHKPKHQQNAYKIITVTNV